jgi:hypothetical protein
MLLEEHMLLYVRQGQNLITHGKVFYLVKQNEMLTLRHLAKIIAGQFVGFSKFQ